MWGVCVCVMGRGEVWGVGGGCMCLSTEAEGRRMWVLVSGEIAQAEVEYEVV